MGHYMRAFCKFAGKVLLATAIAVSFIAFCMWLWFTLTMHYLVG